MGLAGGHATIDILVYLDPRSINETAGQLRGGERVYRNPSTSRRRVARISINSLPPEELSSCEFIDRGS